jgi:hypothetical protein
MWALYRAEPVPVHAGLLFALIVSFVAFCVCWYLWLYVLVPVMLVNTYRIWLLCAMCTILVVAVPALKTL